MAQGFTKDYPQPAVGSVDVFVNGVKQASTSGTEIDFSIPSGVKSVKLTLVGVSTDGTNSLIVRLGDSGGVDTAGYLGANSRFSTGVNSDNATGSWQLSDTMATGRVFHGTATLTLHDEATNTWVFSATTARSDGASTLIGAGSVSLDNELTTVRLTTSSTPDDFDAGSVNIQYDNPNPVVAETVYVSGGVVQTVHTQDGEVATGTTVMPHDDTIPQITEGIEFLTASITPTSTTNKLKIEVVCGASSSVASWMTAALFQDSTAGALAAQTDYRNTVNEHRPVVFTYWMTAGTSSSTTFSVRAGGDLAGTTTFNGNSSVRRFGGVSASSITITEYKV